MPKTISNDVVVEQRSNAERRQAERRQADLPVAAERRKEQRRKVPRRRQIDPTTCERDYNSEEIEFMQALDEYKRSNGRMFPTCSEILEVIKNLGYQRVIADQATCETADQATCETADEATDAVATIEQPELDEQADDTN